LIEDIFKTPVYSTQLDIDNDKLLEECFEIKRKWSKNNLVSNRGGYQSAQLLGLKNDTFQKLSYAIAHHTKIFTEHIHLKVDRLNDLWFNVNYYKDYNLAHNHFGNDNKLSGVYYVKAPKDCGEIVLYHPTKLVEHSWGVNTPKGKHNEYTSPIWKHEAKPGKLIIFPAWLEHRVEHNLSESPRVSFSFNIV